MVAATRRLWGRGELASETAIGRESGLFKFKVHRRMTELEAELGVSMVRMGRKVVFPKPETRIRREAAMEYSPRDLPRDGGENIGAPSSEVEK
jgi:hypothetical protein